MRITFDVGRVTVQENMRLKHIPSNLGKLRILILLTKFIDIPFSEWQFLKNHAVPFSADRV